MPVHDMADATHPRMGRVGGQQHIDLWIMQAAKATMALGCRWRWPAGSTIGLVQRLRAIGARIDMHGGHRVPVGQIAAYSRRADNPAAMASTLPLGPLSSNGPVSHG
jgi:hypothetical protein